MWLNCVVSGENSDGSNKQDASPVTTPSSAMGNYRGTAPSAHALGRTSRPFLPLAFGLPKVL